MSRLYQQAVARERTNSARSDYKRIEVHPIAGALGAEISGVDLSQPLDGQTFKEVHQAFLDHLVIFFRDQNLSPDQHKAFARQFGELHHNDFIHEIEDHPEIVRVARAATDQFVFGNDWHADVTYTKVPSLGSVLYALDVPDFGGDTLFSNLYTAYETLSETMKETLSGLRGLHTAEAIFGKSGAYVQDNYKEGHKATGVSHNEASTEIYAHPIVRVHPETNRKGLFVSSIFTVGIEGMSDDESRAILDFLFEHSVRPDFTSRFRWEKGSLAFWDNRCTLHYALNDAAGVDRLLHRVTVLDGHVDG
ncbi:MAG: TauD/TfdA family dioxygenase [Rhodospirillales bacterium]|nr:TauD/TfdA family dioxygenase [Rhodospirillales bacterium]